jgi:hypothetical protein
MVAAACPGHACAHSRLYADWSPVKTLLALTAILLCCSANAQTNDQNRIKVWAILNRPPKSSTAEMPREEVQSIKAVGPKAIDYVLSWEPSASFRLPPQQPMECIEQRMAVGGGLTIVTNVSLPDNHHNATLIWGVRDMRIKYVALDLTLKGPVESNLVCRAILDAVNSTNRTMQKNGCCALPTYLKTPPVLDRLNALSKDDDPELQYFARTAMQFRLSNKE